LLKWETKMHGQGKGLDIFLSWFCFFNSILLHWAYLELSLIYFFVAYVWILQCRASICDWYLILQNKNWFYWFKTIKSLKINFKLKKYKGSNFKLKTIKAFTMEKLLVRAFHAPTC